jgi:23S rRNA (cytosine1962-C5)-methyltransferase
MPLEIDQYELLDFGEGRKLERFGPVVLDRPCPAAEGLPKSAPDSWRSATAHYERIEADQGRWTPDPGGWSPWRIACGSIALELRATDFGHVGFFPEHQANWTRLESSIERAGRPLRILNLFAYTGGATLAAARAGAQVVHVDSAKGVVGWARRNAEESGLSAAPVRWIVEDAARFVAREVRRGAKYDGLIVDPPSYGHGPRGEAWKIDDDLPPLLANGSKILTPKPALVLLTCHTPGYDGGVLADLLSQCIVVPATGALQRGELVLRTAAGRNLPSGAFAWWERNEP